MMGRTSSAYAFVLLTGIALLMPPGPASALRAQEAQAGPVAAMFASDQKRNPSFAASFLALELPSTGAGGPARVYFSAGDLERAFDTREFRPDAAIVPTNTDLQTAAASPATQRVLIDRVSAQPAVMSDLQQQIAARRAQPPASSGAETGLLRIGLDTFVAQLTPPAGGASADAKFPRTACLVATDFAGGGAIDRRELFVQDRLRKGIAGCLSSLDTAGARSVVLPLMGAGSAKIQSKDVMLEGQRQLTECRLLNATAGIALGIHDFAGNRRSLREIGVVQWDLDIAALFNVPAGGRAARSAAIAYQKYTEQINQAFRKGLAGGKLTAADLDGSCAAILDAR